MKLIDKTYKIYIISFIIGLFAKFCFSNNPVCYIYAILIFSMFLSLFYNAIQYINNKQSFYTGYSFGMGYFLSSLYWVFYSFECVGLEIPGYFAVILLCMYLSIYTGLSCYITSKFHKNSGKISFVILFATSWVFFEYLRGMIFTGFPWNLVGYTTYDIPYFPQIASILGIYGVSFIFLLIIGFIWTRSIKSIIYSISLFCLCYTFGYLHINNILGNHHEIDLKNDYEIIMIQPSIPQEQKMNRNYLFQNTNKCIELSQISNFNIKTKYIIVWPEDSINCFIEEAHEFRQYIAKNVCQNNDNIFIISGADRREKNNIYNSLFIFDKNGNILDFYDKKHLLPFGEFIPDFLSKTPLKKLTEGSINFSKGTKNRRININDIKDIKIDVIICFESVFPEEIVENPKDKPDCIINITNDAWFKKSDEPIQHLKTVCFRAIEYGLPIFRCTNNGISSYINHFGQIIKKLDTNVVDSITINTKQFITVDTIFSQYKNIPIVCILISILLIFITLSKHQCK